MSIWQGENNFVLFKESFSINQKQIWHSFYQLHADNIQVKNEEIAIKKLETIIKATFKLSNQQGFALMSLRDLSNETSISMGSLYAYIGSKNQLAEMIHQFLPCMFSLCQIDATDKKQTNTQQLLKFIAGHIFLSECLQPWFFFAFMETKHLNKSTKKIAKSNEMKTQLLLNQIITEGQLQKEFDSVDIFLTCMTIKSCLQNWYIKHYKYHQAKVHCENYISFVEEFIGKHLGFRS